MQKHIPLDPNGTWEEVAQSQSYSYHACVYAWLSRRTDITMHVDLGPLQGRRSLQQLSELGPEAVTDLRNEYTNTLVSLACFPWTLWTLICGDEYTDTLLSA